MYDNVVWTIIPTSGAILTLISFCYRASLQRGICRVPALAEVWYEDTELSPEVV